MTPRVVYDTNVLVSALLREQSDIARLVNVALQGHVIPCLSQPMLDEYEEVLRRRKFHFDPDTAHRFLRDFRKHARMVTPKRRVHLALDEDDNKFLECARTAHAHYLVTGNRKHFPFASFGKTQIVSPTELARMLLQ